MPVWSTFLPIYARDVFAAGRQGLGLLLTAVGAGGTLGGFAANALVRVERQGLVQAIWILVMCAAIVRLAASPSLVIAMVCAGVGGAAAIAVLVLYSLAPTLREPRIK